MASLFNHVHIKRGFIKSQGQSSPQPHKHFTKNKCLCYAQDIYDMVMNFNLQ